MAALLIALALWLAVPTEECFTDSCVGCIYDCLE